jgi:ABC-type lipoprotein release transport system permease subunit
VTAIWTRARSELRAGRRSLIGLSLILGLICGVVLTAAEGARRTDTAYPRFVAAIKTPEVFAISGNDPKGPIPVVDLHRVLELRQVRTGLVARGLFGVAESIDGDILWNGDLNLSVGAPTDRALQRFGWGAKLLAGRFPNPSRPDEVAVGYRQHPDPRMQIGDRIKIALVRPDVPESALLNGIQSRRQLLPPITVRIVGIGLGQGELQGSHDIIGTPAFYRKYVGTTLTLPVLGAFLKHGNADFPAFSEGVDRISPGAIVFSANDEESFVNRSTHLLAVSLWLFAAIAAVAGLLIFGQALSRSTWEGAIENPTLHSIGMTRAQLFGLSMLRAAIVACGGAALGVVIAFLASPVTPFGRFARVAEPNPGFSFDSLVLLGGGAVLALTVLALALYPSWRAATVEGDSLGLAELRGSNRPSRVADELARAGMSPSGATGVRMALQPGRGRTATPVRVTVFGVAISLAALATALTFGSSFRHLFETPRLYGHNWTLTAGSPYLDPGTTRKVQQTLEAQPEIVDIGKADIREFVVLGPADHGVRVNAFGFQAVQGSIAPTIVEGRGPTGLDEVALGTKTLHELGASIGDRIQVRSGQQTEAVTVVGTAELPVAFGPGLDEGVAMPFEELRRLVPTAIANGFAVTLRDGVDPAAEVKKLNTSLAKYGADAQLPLEGENLDSLRRVDNLPFVLAALLGAAALLTLAHTLVTSVRKRRRDFAVLKTLGFVRHQVSATVAWQATTIGLLALAIGIPVGIAIGRWGWNIFSEQIGVVPEPVTPVVFALLLIPIALLFANLVAALPARSAGKLRPAPVLRTE